MLLAVGIPILVYVYSPIREHVVNHYALRWYVQQNSSDRSVRIRVHNLSSNVSLPITLKAEYPGSKIIEFEYSDPWDGPRISSLKTARHSEILRQFGLSLKKPILLDEHLIPSSLEEIEDELQGAVLVLSLPQSHGKPGPTSPMTLDNHLVWVEQCRKSESAHSCYLERAWENWEYMLRGIQGDETASWKQLTGVQLGFPDFHIVPEDRMNYIFSLAAGHSISFFLRYGVDRLDGKVNLFASDGSALRVNKEADLDRPIWVMIVLYPLVDPVYGLLVLALVLAMLPWWAPLKFLSTFTIVNQALAKVDQMDTAREWDEVYGRLKFSLKDKFDYYRSILSRPPESLASEDLFDYLRGYLRVVYRGGVGRFRDNRQLETTINRCLLELASK